MTDPGWPAGFLERVRTEREVTIVTRSPDGTAHEAIIWAIVDPADRVLIRSWKGSTARWFRQATSGTGTLLRAGPGACAVTIHAATDSASVQACSAGLAAKYAGDPSTPGMLRPEILDTTLELRPA